MKLFRSAPLRALLLASALQVFILFCWVGLPSSAAWALKASKPKEATRALKNSFMSISLKCDVEPARTVRATPA